MSGADKALGQASSATNRPLINTPKTTAPAPSGNRSSATVTGASRRTDAATSKPSAVAHPATGDLPPHLAPQQATARAGSVLAPTPQQPASASASAVALAAAAADSSAALGNQGDASAAQGDTASSTHSSPSFSPGTLDEQRAHIRDCYLTDALELDIDMQTVPGASQQVLTMTTRDQLESVRILKPSPEYFPRVGTPYRFAVGLIGHIESLIARLDNYLGWVQAALHVPSSRQVDPSWAEKLMVYLNDEYIRYGEIVRMLRYVVEYCVYIAVRLENLLHLVSDSALLPEPSYDDVSLKGHFNNFAELAYRSAQTPQQPEKSGSASCTGTFC